MDPLSVTASGLAIVSQSLKTLQRFRELRRNISGSISWITNTELRAQYDNQLCRFENCTLLFEELHGQPYRHGSRLLYSVTGKLDSCMRYLKEIEDLIGGSAGTQFVKSAEFRQLSLAIDCLESNVWFMRDLRIMETLFHLENQYEDVAGRLNNVVESVEAINTIGTLLERLESQGAAKQPGYTDLCEAGTELGDIQDALHETKEMLQSILKPQKSNSRSSSGLAFPFNIIPTQRGKNNTVARVQLDTGCQENWIRQELVDRAELQESIQSVDEPRIYSGFGGTFLTPIGRIQITWFSENESLTRISDFLVHGDVPFDAVLGRESILGDGGVAFSSPLLALRHLDLDQEELRAIESNARHKGASNKQITEIRKATDAGKREEARRTKAASRASTIGYGRSLYSEAQTPHGLLRRGSTMLHSQMAGSAVGRQTMGSTSSATSVDTSLRPVSASTAARGIPAPDVEEVEEELAG